jgi:LuxR family transcriptional regulator, maltose regulon positive regulatory protein
MATSTAPSRTPAAAGGTSTPVVPGPVAGLVERPRLFDLLDRGSTGPVTLLTGPPGSGKTMLLSSWLRRVQPPPAVAWIEVERDERDATRFWAMVMDGLRRSGAIAPEDPLATLTPGAGGGGDEFLERLTEGLERLPKPVFLVLDDLHHLRADDALAGIERLLTRAPPPLRTFIVSRRDPKLGLHRLRLAGALVEVRGADLGFTAEETASLLAASGVAVGEDDVGRLHERTEGWAAGLRLAALSLTRHEQPGRFVAEFSGSERTVADYLLGEVLASQPPEVRRLLLRTCIVERITGPLADRLTGRGDGARLLHALEEANALVVAVDVGRTWFRYHHLLADLLRLELQLEAPDEVPVLHRVAAEWFAAHGHAVDAIRHAELAGDTALAAELIGRHWVGLVLDGEEATLGSLLAGLPSALADSDAEVATIIAATRLAESRWEQADALLAVADRALPAVPDDRRRRAETALVTARLMRARRLGDMEAVVQVSDAVAGGAGGIAAAGDVPGGDDLEALALMNLGIAESWILRLEDAEAHLERALALGGRTGRPYLEIGCLGGLGTVANITQRLGVAEERLRQAVAVAERVGWSRHPLVGPAYLSLGAVLIERGRPAQAAGLLDRADAILAASPEPAASVGLHHVQGMLATAQGRFADALARFREGGRLAASLRAPHFLAPILRQWELRSRLRLGEVDAVRAAVAELEPVAQTSTLAALLALTDGDPDAAAAAVAPVLAGDAFVFHVNVEIEAALVDALARRALGDEAAAEAGVERALALTEREGRLWVVLTVPGARDLLAAHPAHRTAHAAQLRLLLDHLSGVEPAAAAGAGEPPAEELSERELAVLRFLPTNLSANEIGSELFLSVHTVKTHMRRLYAKLDVHTRAEAVARGRALGLLAPAVRRG